MLIVTHSSISSFRTCPRKYFFAYVLKYVPVIEALALSLGRALHLALEKWWLESKEAALAVLKKNAGSISETDTAKLCAMLKHYAPPREHLHVVAVEQEYSTLVRAGKKTLRGVRYCCKIDGLLEDDNGPALLEHKSTSKSIIGFDRYWQKLTVDSQMLWYMLASDTRVCYYDVLRKPQLRQKKTETVDQYQERCEQAIQEDKEKYYQFRRIPRSDSDLLQARQDLYDWTVIVRQAHKHNRWPQNPGSCLGNYGTCEYLEVCAERATLQDAAQFRRKDAQHEELGF